MQVRMVEKLLNCKGLKLNQPTRISKYEVCAKLFGQKFLSGRLCEKYSHIKYFDNLEQVVDWFFEVFYGRS